MSGTSVEDWERFMAGSPDLKYAESFPGVPTMLTGRVDKEELPFNDVKVRQALNLAVNQQEILDDYYKGKGTLLAYPFLPSASFSDVYVPLEEMPVAVQELFEYKPEKARQLLAEAGYPTGFKTEVVCNSNEVDLLSIIREYLLAVGVDMEIKPVEGGAHFGMKKGRTYSQMILGDTLPHAYWKMHEVRPESSSNNSFWGSDETRAAYNEVMKWVGKDDTKVKQAIKNVVPHILENAWGVWLPQRYLYTMWWPWVQNYRGELNFGSVSDAIYRIFIWYDVALKKSMGY